MTSFTYYLECGHKQVHQRKVKTQVRFNGDYIWCGNCRNYKKVMRLTENHYRQPKLTTFTKEGKGQQ